MSLKENPLKHPFILSVAIFLNILFSPIVAIISAITYVRKCKRGEIGGSEEEQETSIPRKRLKRLIISNPISKRGGVGEILDFMIEAHGLTRSAFSQKIDVNPSQLQYWLNSEGISFSLEKADKMAKALEFETTGSFLHYLVDGAKLRQKSVAKMILTQK